MRCRRFQIGEAASLVGSKCCGSSWWKAAERIVGMDSDEAVVWVGRETRFFCSEDPSGWDPIYGKSPVHPAGRLHGVTLGNAFRRQRGCEASTQ